MSYPSLLWNHNLSNTLTHDKKISENVLKDLTLSEDFRGSTKEYLTMPCSADEIQKRHVLLSRALEDEEFLVKLGNIKKSIGELSNLFAGADHIYEEKVLLFVPVMSRFFEIVRVIASLPADVVPEAEYFVSVLKDPDCAEAEKYCEEISSKFSGDVHMTLKGTDAAVSHGKNMLRTELEDMFRAMELPDAVPSEPRFYKSDEYIIKAYSVLCGVYYENARIFYEKYNYIFLSGKYDIHEFFRYIDEITFINDICSYFERLREAGYPLVFPENTQNRVVEIDTLYDVSLYKRGLTCGESVPNDVRMSNDGENHENFFILTGANGGGKTTFLRSCAISVLFFITGCPIVAKRAVMYPFDSVYTHFPANESFEDSGRFANETERAEKILESADENSFAVFNETYSGTDEKKSEDYSSRLASEMYSRGVFGIFVTHIHSLTGGKIPTLAAVIDENNDNRRTYKIKRVGSTSSSYAADILEKYGLDKKSLMNKLHEKKGGSKNDAADE